MNEGTFEILEHQTNVKVMGPTIFSDLSKMMSKSLHITKWCLLADAGLFGLSILLPTKTLFSSLSRIIPTPILKGSSFLIFT